MIFPHRSREGGVHQSKAESEETKEPCTPRCDRLPPQDSHIRPAKLWASWLWQQVAGGTVHGLKFTWNERPADPGERKSHTAGIAPFPCKVTSETWKTHGAWHTPGPGGRGLLIPTDHLESARSWDITKEATRTQNEWISEPPRFPPGNEGVWLFCPVFPGCLKIAANRWLRKRKGKTYDTASPTRLTRLLCFSWDYLELTWGDRANSGFAPVGTRTELFPPTFYFAP